MDHYISFIVPMFNAEKYIDHCLQSIQSQTYENYEVIIVDDGSSDHSAQICKEFVRSDSRFKYYYKENGGSSSARNFGLNIASGDYIAFVDADDYIDSDYLEYLVSGLCDEEYDIVHII